MNRLRLILPLWLLLVSCCAYAQQVRLPLSNVDNLPIYDKSYESSKSIFRNNIGGGRIDPEEILDISRHSYWDLGGQQYVPWPLKNNECEVDIRFRFAHASSYEILLLEIGQSECRRSVLATRSISDGIVDTLEVERFFYCCGNGERFLTKEFSLDSILNVTVWEYESLEKEPIEFLMENIDSYHARRIDSHYQIDPQTGKIRLLKRRYYEPRHYPKAYIRNGDKRIKNGGEELEREEIIPAVQ